MNRDMGRDPTSEVVNMIIVLHIISLCQPAVSYNKLLSCFLVPNLISYMSARFFFSYFSFGTEFFIGMHLVCPELMCSAN